MSPRPKRLRGLFSTETLYADVDTAKRAFEEERINKAIRDRAPTPFHRSNGSEETIHRRASNRSLRSRVSFDSTRSRRSTRTIQDLHEEALEWDAATVGPWEPTFGGRHGLGPAGEAYEVIGLGRKSPRHRKFHSYMLKPAMKSASRRASRIDMRTDPHHYPDNHGRGHHHRPRQDKPLPSRPLSYVAPAFGQLLSSTATLSRQLLPLPSTPTHNQVHTSVNAHTRSMSALNPSSAAFRSLLSSLAIDPSTSSSSRQRLPLAQNQNGSRGRHDLLVPAEDLFAYLHLATLPSWRDWPASGPPPRHGTLFSGSRSKGFESMGWEWRRRLQLTEAARPTRGLRVWDGVDKHWEKKILEWVEDNVPSQPIDPGNRWGNQIFALPATGFDSLEFFDENQQSAEDKGLLSWLTGSLLQTMTSTLHMLRYSSSSFTFHLIPGPRPPLPTPLLDDEKPDEPYSGPHCLWEGFGTMVLVNKDDSTDRSMIIEIRPPDVVDDRVLKEFSRRSRTEGWWHLPGETCVGEAGQANLLQAQVYDDCVQNNVYYFAVTNLKQWVFGSFNSSFSACTTSPVIDRKQREPSLVQCLAAWAIRSVDERPRRSERHASANRAQAAQGHGSPISHSQSELRARRSAAPTPMPGQAFDFSPDPSFGSSQTSFNSFPPTPTAPHGQFAPPGYFDMMASTSAYPQPGYGGAMGGYATWNASQRAFSPVPSYGSAGSSWYTGGFGWGMR